MVVESTCNKPRYTITGIGGKKGFASITIEKAMMNTEVGFGRRVLEVFEDAGMTFEHTPSGIDTFSVFVNQHEFEPHEQQIIAGLHRKVRPDMIELESDLALIAVVGRGMRRTRGTAGRIFSALAHAHVNVKMIDQGSSELNIIIGVENRDFEAVLERLEETRHTLEQEQKKAELATQNAEKLRAKAQSERDKTEQLKKNELEKAKREAEKLLQQAKRQASDFLLELEKLKKEQAEATATELAKKTRRAMKNQLGEMDELINPREIADNWDYDYKLPREPKVGDAVIIKNIGEGEIVEIKNDRILVKSGMLKTRVKLSDIMLTEKKKKAAAPQRSIQRTSSRADADVKTELDLRGQTVEEALGNLGIFIDKCILNGMNEVRIIHGKGTGALRSAVQEELRHHPNVKSYRLGVWGEGDNGVTVAELK